MAESYEGDGAAANGFGWRHLMVEEATALNNKGYPAPPNMRCSNTWKLSAGGVPIPPETQGAARAAAIHQHFNIVMPTSEELFLAWLRRETRVPHGQLRRPRCQQR
jgi:hypothetical protein